MKRVLKVVALGTPQINGGVNENQAGESAFDYVPILLGNKHWPHPRERAIYHARFDSSGGLRHGPITGN